MHTAVKHRRHITFERIREGYEPREWNIETGYVFYQIDAFQSSKPKT